MALKAPTFEVSYAGRLRQGPRLNVGGRLKVSVPSLKKFLTWMGTPNAATAEGGLFIESSFSIRPGFYRLKKLTVEAPRLHVSASAKYRDTTPRSLNAHLQVSEADLNHLFGDPTTKPSESAPEAPANKKIVTVTGWSHTRTDWSALHNGKVAIDLQKITYGKLFIPDAHASATIKGGALTILLDKTQVGGGVINARAELNTSEPIARISYGVSVKDVALEPLLHAVPGLNRLSGTASIEMQGRGAGASAANMMASLSGHGKVEIKKGALSGINVVAILRRAGTLDLATVTPDQSTPFDDVQLAYTLKNGVVTSAEKQISVRAPQLAIEGMGTTSFPERHLDYHLSAQLIKTPGEKGGINPLANVPIPISISGNWSAPSTNIDWLHVFKQIATDPTRVAQLPNSLRKYATTLGVSIALAPVDLIESIAGGDKDKKDADANPDATE